MNINQTTNSDDFTISFFDLFIRIKQNIYLFFIIFLIIVTLSFIYAISTKNVYKSEALIQPNSSSAGIQNQLSSSFGGLQSIAGISFGAEVSDTQNIIEKIQSKDFFNELVKNNDMLLPKLIAIDGYDFTNQKISYDKNIFNDEKKEWVREPKSSIIKAKPTYLEGHYYYKKALTIYPKNKTNMIYISIEHISPAFAYSFLSDILSTADKLYKNEDFKESSMVINYARNEYNKYNYKTIKDSISNIIDSQLKIQMSTQINSEYKFKTIDKPFYPEKKSKPNRTLIIVIGFFIGLLFSTSMTILYSFVKPKK